jgi:hypothetical protein
MHTQAMRLRAVVMVGETALAWARQDQRSWAGGASGMVRHVDALVARIKTLLRERVRRQALLYGVGLQTEYAHQTRQSSASITNM